MDKLKKITQSVTSSILLGCLSVLVVLTAHFMTVNWKNERVRDAKLLMDSEVAKIHSTLDFYLHIMTTFEKLVVQKGGMIDNFKEVAKDLYKEDGPLLCIQLSIEGKITTDTIYPLDKYDNHLGAGDLFKNPDRKEAVEYAVKNKVTTFSGPFKLHQKDENGKNFMGFVARKPIFISNGGEEEFFGFSILVFELERLLNSAELNNLEEQGYVYQIRKNNVYTGESEYFLPGVTISDKANATNITVAESVWTFSLIPKDGWVPLYVVLSVCVIVAFVEMLIVIIFIHNRKIRRLIDSQRMLAITDELTGLNNARAFNQALDDMIASKVPFALFYIDLNKFKNINDTYGHTIGDGLLTEMGGRIRNMLQSDCKAFRIGGDEFAIIMKISSRADCESMIKYFKQMLNGHLVLDGTVVDVTISCGYALYPKDSHVKDNLMQIADARMYADKRDGNGFSGMSTREYFLNVVDKVIKDNYSEDGKDSLYFFHFDFGNFKHVNYVHGTDAGDELIKNVVEYFNNIEECILCSRGYADHFFLLVKEPKDVSIDTIKEKFKRFATVFLEREKGKYLQTELTIWGGFTNVADMSVKDIVGRANLARRRTKEEKADLPVFLDAVAAKEYMDGKATEKRVICAVVNGGVEYYLQSKVNPYTNVTTSFEALGRIRDEEGNMIFPNVFIPILENTGEIIDFDLMVLRKVCCDLRARIDAGARVLPVSVNLSRLHIDAPHSLEKIEAIFNEYKIPPKTICFEITESIIIKNSAALADFCNKLRGMGADISIDDFGVGCTSISLIKDVVIDEVKLDRSFLGNKNGAADRYTALLESIIEMAKKISVRIVFEGVETKEQLEYVKTFKVIDEVQGYYYSKPLPANEVYDLL